MMTISPYSITSNPWFMSFQDIVLKKVDGELILTFAFDSYQKLKKKHRVNKTSLFLSYVTEI